MSKRFLLAFVVMTGFVIAIAAAPQKPDLSRGNGLLEACTSTVEIDQNICFGYIQGASDALQFLGNGQKSFCYPASVTMGQIMDIVIKFLKENPEKRHLYSPQLISSALHEAFPCPSD